MHGRNRVIKLFIPFYELKQARIGEQPRGELTDNIIKAAKTQPYQRREYKFLSAIDHPFVVKVHDFGFETLRGTPLDNLKIRTAQGMTASEATLPYIIASYVEGDNFDIALTRLNRRLFLRVLQSLAEAIDFLHVRHELLHGDIKSANVRVRHDGYPALVDFALSQDLAGELSSERVLGGLDWDLVPFRHGASPIADQIQRVQSEGMTKAEFRDIFFPWLDYYQLGLVLQRAREAVDAFLTPAESRFLRVILATLVDWDRVTRVPVGALADMMERLDATRFYLAVRPGSLSGSGEFSVAGDRMAFVPPLLRPVAEHPGMTRLSRLNQLSLLPARFPGATHSRYEHSLDTMRVCQSLARRLLDVPEFRLMFSEEDIHTLLAAALLHDVNHVPLMHLYQESGLPDFGAIDLFELAFADRDDTGTTLAEALSESGIDPDRVRRLISGDWAEQAGDHEDADRLFRRSSIPAWMSTSYPTCALTLSDRALRSRRASIWLA
jgi:hypothetical protein